MNLRFLTVTVLVAALSSARGASASDSLLLVTQSCLGKKCDVELLATSSASSVTDRVGWRGPQQEYFSDVEEDLSGRWFVTDQGRLRIFGPDLRAEGFVGSKKEIAYSNVFDAAGNAYVGVFTLGGTSIRKYDSRGELVTSFKTPDPVYATDLSADQCTLFYTSDPRGAQVVHRFNVCAGAPMEDWKKIDALTVMQIRLLPDGGMLAATSQDVQRIDANGVVVRRYDIGGSDRWRGVALTSDAKSFWAATINGAAEFDLESGRVLDEVAGPNEGVVGIAVKGGWRAARDTVGRPAPPSDLAVRLPDDGSLSRLQLQWRDHADNEEGFEIEYRVNFGPWIELGTVNANVTKAVMEGVKPGRQLTFRVRAFNAKGVSGYSNEATINGTR